MPLMLRGDGTAEGSELTCLLWTCPHKTYTHTTLQNQAEALLTAAALLSTGACGCRGSVEPLSSPAQAVSLRLSAGGSAGHGWQGWRKTPFQHREGHLGGLEGSLTSQAMSRPPSLLTSSPSQPPPNGPTTFQFGVSWEVLRVWGRHAL